MLVLYIGVLSLAGVCAVNAARAVVAERKPLASQWYPAALAAAAAAGAAAAVLALHAIHARGGFYMPEPAAQIVGSGTALLHNLGIAGQGLLLLGGADFLGLPVTASAGFIVLHVVGVGLAAWGTGLAALRFLRDRDLAAQLLVTSVAVNLAIYVLSTKSAVVTQNREIAPVLPFAAALAGRLLAPACGGPACWGPACWPAGSRRPCDSGWRRSWPSQAPATWPAWSARSASRQRPRRTPRSPRGSRPGTCAPACPATGSRTSSR